MIAVRQVFAINISRSEPHLSGSLCVAAVPGRSPVAQVAATFGHGHQPRRLFCLRKPRAPSTHILIATSGSGPRECVFPVRLAVEPPKGKGSSPER